MGAIFQITMNAENMPDQKDDGAKLILYISRFADDNQGQLYEMQLENEGYSVLLTDSGKSAAAALHKGAGFIDLIIMGRRYLGKVEDPEKPNDIESLGDFVPDIGALEQALVGMEDNAPPVLIHSSATSAHAKEQYSGTPVERLIVGYVQKSADPGPFLKAVHDALHTQE